MTDKETGKEGADETKGVEKDKNTKVTERDTMPGPGRVGPSGSVAASLHDHLVSLFLFVSRRG